MPKNIKYYTTKESMEHDDLFKTYSEISVLKQKYKGAVEYANNKHNRLIDEYNNILAAYKYLYDRYKEILTTLENNIIENKKKDEGTVIELNPYLDELHKNVSIKLITEVINNKDIKPKNMKDEDLAEFVYKFIKGEK